MGKIVIPSPVYPDIDSLDFKERLKKFGIEDVQFLLDDGVQITYADDIEPLDVKPDSVTFYEARSKVPVIKYIANFDYAEFYLLPEEETPIVMIKTFNI